ncbi:hypothetical protein BGZ73_003224, partial [Actinomortierella ambigua]
HTVASPTSSVHIAESKFMLKATAEEYWAAVSDIRDANVAQPTIVDQTHQQLQHLEKVYGNR